MRPLTRDDLLSLDEYAERRGEFLESLHHYVDQYRRVRIGPALTLVFENRQTLWFRLHEILHVARVGDPSLVQQELDLYNHLLPSRNQLHAALLVSVSSAARLTRELAAWHDLRGDDLTFRIGNVRAAAELITCRPEDRCIGAAHLVQFQLDAHARRGLADACHPAWFAMSHRDYRHESPPLGDEIRQSLLEDLELSDRD